MLRFAHADLHPASPQLWPTLPVPLPPALARVDEFLRRERYTYVAKLFALDHLFQTANVNTEWLDPEDKGAVEGILRKFPELVPPEDNDPLDGFDDGCREPGSEG